MSETWLWPTSLVAFLYAIHLGLKQQKLCVGFLLTNRQFWEVGHCRRHISGFLVAKFYVEFENATFTCDNLRPFDN